MKQQVHNKLKPGSKITIRLNKVTAPLMEKAIKRNPSRGYVSKLMNGALLVTLNHLVGKRELTAHQS
jgi:hypothetical protein